MTRIAIALYLLAQAAPAQTAPDMQGKVRVFIKDPDVKEGWRESEVVRPGDTVRYRLEYQNKGTGPAVGFTLQNEIPEGTLLLERPTARNCRLEFSHDEGRTYAENPTRKVNGKTVPVPPAEFTHLRCRQTPPQIAPGEQVAAEYLVLVK